MMEVEFVTVEYLKTLSQEATRSRAEDIEKHCRLASFWRRRYRRLKDERDRHDYLFLFLAQQKKNREEGKRYDKVLDLEMFLKNLKRKKSRTNTHNE